MDHEAEGRDTDGRMNNPTTVILVKQATAFTDYIAGVPHGLVPHGDGSCIQ